MAEASGLDIGHYISGTGHLGLLGWVAFGSLFALDPDPFEVREVTIVSAQEFDAMFAPKTLLETVMDVAPLQSLDPKEVPVEVPVEVVDVNPEAPKLARSSAPDSVLDKNDLNVVVDPEPIEMPLEPQFLIEQLALLMPDVEEPPVPKRVAKQVPKIKPAPEVAPEPDVVVDQDAVPSADAEEAAETLERPTEKVVKEEASAETKIEEKNPPSKAPTRSLRPKFRPLNIAPTRAESVALALQEAMNAPEPVAPVEQSTPSAPPLTLDESQAFNQALSDCWQVDPGARSSNVLITIVMNWTRDGKLVAGSLRMTDSEGGSGPAVKTAFQKAQVAILRCQNKIGATLPPEKYERWKETKTRFNPSKMRTR